MPETPSRHVEVRVIVIATVDLSDPGLIDALKDQRRKLSSVTQVVADEIVSDLESVSYIDSVIVGQL